MAAPIVPVLALAPVAVERLAQLSAPWHDLYADSKVLPTAVLFVHFAALLVGGGMALSADRATLHAARLGVDERQRQLVALGGIHRWVVGALALLFASGALLALADVETFATSPVFWTKMGLIALLLANGFAMTRTEQSLGRAPLDAGRLWRRLQRLAVASVALWLAIVLAGTILTNA